MLGDMWVFNHYCIINGYCMCVQFQLSLVQAILAKMEGHARTVWMDFTANALNGLLTVPVAQVSHDIDVPEIIRGDLYHAW